MTGITNATAVSSASNYSCALLSDKTIRCWGQGWNGTMGDGSSTSWYVPANKVSGITTATEVSTTGSHACALLSAGTVHCWGRNFYGSLGGGQVNVSMIQLTPINVSKISNATSITTGGYGSLGVDNPGFSCALLSAGTIKCWGNDNYGQLGSGAKNAQGYSATPVSVDGINTATAISAGVQHTCALLADKTIKCWGASWNGQLGSGAKNTETYTSGSNTNTTNASFKPVSVSGINTAIAISAGGSHTCALLEDKTVKCWGNNQNGQFGDGLGASSLTPKLTLF